MSPVLFWLGIVLDEEDDLKDENLMKRIYRKSIEHPLLESTFTLWNHFWFVCGALGVFLIVAVGEVLLPTTLGGVTTTEDVLGLHSILIRWPPLVGLGCVWVCAWLLGLCSLSDVAEPPKKDHDEAPPAAAPYRLILFSAGLLFAGVYAFSSLSSGSGGYNVFDNVSAALSIPSKLDTENEQTTLVALVEQRFFLKVAHLTRFIILALLPNAFIACLNVKNFRLAQEERDYHDVTKPVKARFAPGTTTVAGFLDDEGLYLSLVIFVRLTVKGLATLVGFLSLFMSLSVLPLASMVLFSAFYKSTSYALKYWVLTVVDMIVFDNVDTRVEETTFLKKVKLYALALVATLILAVTVFAPLQFGAAYMLNKVGRIFGFDEGSSKVEQVFRKMGGQFQFGSSVGGSDNSVKTQYTREDLLKHAEEKWETLDHRVDGGKKTPHDVLNHIAREYWNSMAKDEDEVLKESPKVVELPDDPPSAHDGEWVLPEDVVAPPKEVDSSSSVRKRHESPAKNSIESVDAFEVGGQQYEFFKVD